MVEPRKRRIQETIKWDDCCRRSTFRRTPARSTAPLQPRYRPPRSSSAPRAARPQGAARGRAAAAEEDGGPRGAGSGARPRRTHREKACAGAAPADLPPAGTRTRRSAAEYRAGWRWRPPGPPLRRSSLQRPRGHPRTQQKQRPPAEKAVPPTRWPPRTAPRCPLRQRRCCAQTPPAAGGREDGGCEGRDVRATFAPRCC